MNTTPLLLIENNGIEITDTNYWESDWAMRDLCYLSWNAGAGRLLVPDNVALSFMTTMLTAKSIIIDRRSCRQGMARSHFDIVFDDRTKSPFILTLDNNMTDRSLGPANAQPRTFTVWVNYCQKVMSF
ncbi:hypothetical protein Acife_1944 [Acidithiobacillus ferrivorans SS3]|uniref:Uncharacterized protein n=1 Tax=Acidithiobacillus ferrivorans SS3 TaxID=743299 RepID=G0JLL8_9PROT|nr:hypothetical protein [Acidithiobacillus ferrivorans]AEM48067.1 hypothetical protein Acife_1944 [Acidithiobacillus ferrivorans SS3]